MKDKIFGVLHLSSRTINKDDKGNIYKKFTILFYYHLYIKKIYFFHYHLFI